MERTAWVAFGLFVVAAAAGVFGSGGFLSRGEVRLGETTVSYPTTARWQAGDNFFVELAGAAGERTLTLSSGFASAFRIDDVQPMPSRVEATDTGHAYVFTSTSETSIEVHLAVTPRQPGLATYSLTAELAPPRRLSTFVWP